MKNMIFILVFLSSCGVDNSSSLDKSSTTENKRSEEPKIEAENPVAMIVENEPECKINGQLIYIKSSAEFKSCDGKNWTVVEVTNKTQTINNSYTAENVYTDTINGNDWLIMYPVQKTKILTICPTGFKTASKAQFEFVRTQTDLITNYDYVHSAVIYYWSSEGELGRNGAWFSTTMPSGYKANGNAVVCVK